MVSKFFSFQKKLQPCSNFPEQKTKLGILVYFLRKKNIPRILKIDSEVSEIFEIITSKRISALPGVNYFLTLSNPSLV